MRFPKSISDLVFFFLVQSFFLVQIDAWSADQTTTAPLGFLDRIGLPAKAIAFKNQRKLVIAIVDDGFRLTHQALKDHIYTNPKEIPGNGRDDDGNTYIDDVHGWDISDRDSDVTPPSAKLNDYYHGTHIAGILMEVLKKAGAEDQVQIMPVKVLADRADKSYLFDGYKGIRYAAQSGADIILCSWGLNVFTPEEKTIVKEAQDKGAWVVASAGNLNFEKPQYPASFPDVIAVGALDSLSRKSDVSNFGSWVDISAPGTDIGGADVGSDTGITKRSGTSTSAPMVAAAMALLKLEAPGISSEEMERCLKAGSVPIDNANPGWEGKLGAGSLNIQGALECADFKSKNAAMNIDRHPEGYLHYFHSQAKEADWRLLPEGKFPGLWFKLRIKTGKAGNGVFKFITSEKNESALFKKIKLSEFPESLFVPTPNVFVKFKPMNSSKDLEWILSYKSMTLDSSTVFCRDQIDLHEPGTLTDGSGPDNYTAGTSCKWLITAPPGKVVHFKFNEMDTEVKTDMLYFFDGNRTNQPVMAIYTGHELPPDLTSWNNQVLVWFVTNSSIQGQGWKLEYTFIDKPKDKR